MKPKNFPDRVMRRRARAYERKHGHMPANYDSRCEMTDIKFRRVHGRNRVTEKFE